MLTNCSLSDQFLCLPKSVIAALLMYRGPVAEIHGLIRAAQTISRSVNKALEANMCLRGYCHTKVP